MKNGNKLLAWNVSTNLPSNQSPVSGRDSPWGNKGHHSAISVRYPITLGHAPQTMTPARRVIYPYMRDRTKPCRLTIDLSCLSYCLTVHLSCLSYCLTVHLSCLSYCLTIHLSCLAYCLTIHLSCLSYCLTIHLSCLSYCLTIHLSCLSYCLTVGLSCLSYCLTVDLS